MYRAFLFLCCLVSGCSSQLDIPVVTPEPIENIDENLTWGKQFEFALQFEGGRYSASTVTAEYVNEVGQRIAHENNLGNHFTFAVINRPTPDAWVLPGGYVAITRGLLVSLQDEAELAAILAHQLAHAEAIPSHYIAPAYSDYLRKPLLLKDAGQSIENRYTNYILGTAGIFHDRLSERFGRIDELSADRVGQHYMAQAGYDPSVLVSVQNRYLGLLSSGAPNWTKGMLKRHPPSEERIVRGNENVRRLEFNHPFAIRAIDQATFDASLRSLKKTSDAYRLYEKALEIVVDDSEAAANLIDRAIAANPDEVHFYGFRAETSRSAAECEMALDDYRQALKVDHPHYSYYLGRGHCYLALGEIVKARADFEKSMLLLPSASAALEIAKIALTLGDSKTAKRFYLRVMTSNGAGAKEAQAAFVRIDLADNPQLYFLSQSLVRDGQFTTIVTNQSGHDVDGIEVQFSATINGVKRDVVTSAGSLPAHDQVRFYPGWEVLDSDTIEDVYVRVIHLKM